MEQSSRVGVFAKMTEYHEDIPRIAASLQQIQRTLSSGRMSSVVEAYRLFQRYDIAGHFLLEDQVIFPAVARSNVSQIVKNQLTILSHEHVDMLRRSAMLGEVLAQLGTATEIPPETLDKLKVALHSLGALLITHARKEDELVVPLVSGNSSIQLVMGKLLHEFRAKIANEGAKAPPGSPSSSVEGPKATL